MDQILADEQLLEGEGGYDLETPGTVVWPLTDNLGTVRDLAFYDPGTDTTMIANHRVYDAFGTVTDETYAPVECLFAFTGRPYDKATGLQNNLHRWYDPKTGAWISQDWIEFLGGDMNLGRYCGNSPTNRIDPNGTNPPNGSHPPLDFTPSWTFTPSISKDRVRKIDQFYWGNYRYYLTHPGKLDKDLLTAHYIAVGMIAAPMIIATGGVTFMVIVDMPYAVTATVAVYGTEVISGLGPPSSMTSLWNGATQIGSALWNFRN